jgi:hypothetical protein
LIREFQLDLINAKETKPDVKRIREFIAKESKYIEILDGVEKYFIIDWIGKLQYRLGELTDNNPRNDSSDFLGLIEQSCSENNLIMKVSPESPEKADIALNSEDNLAKVSSELTATADLDENIVIYPSIASSDLPATSNLAGNIIRHPSKDSPELPIIANLANNENTKPKVSSQWPTTTDRANIYEIYPHPKANLQVPTAIDLAKKQDENKNKKTRQNDKTVYCVTENKKPGKNTQKSTELVTLTEDPNLKTTKKLDFKKANFAEDSLNAHPGEDYNGTTIPENSEQTVKLLVEHPFDFKKLIHSY